MCVKEVGLILSFLLFFSLLGINKTKPESLNIGLGSVIPASSGQWLVHSQNTGTPKTSRAYWHEDTPEPASSLDRDIELVSAIVNYEDDPKLFSAIKEMKVKFYLPLQSNVNVVIQEVSPKYNYSYREALSCNAGFDNIFKIPKIDDKKGISAQDLYVLVRIGKDNEKPKTEESVAPAIIYYSHLPETISGYSFTFKVSQTAMLNTKFQRRQRRNAKPVCTQNYPSRTPGKFTVKCDLPNEPGEYEWKADGYFLGSKRPIHQTVVFFHQPAVNGIPSRR